MLGEPLVGVETTGILMAHCNAALLTFDKRVWREGMNAAYRSNVGLAVLVRRCTTLCLATTLREC